MSQNTNKTKGKSIVSALILSVSALLFHLLGAYFSVGLSKIENPFAAIIGAIPFIFLSVLFYSVLAVRRGRGFTPVMLIPPATSLVYFSESSMYALIFLLASATPIVGSGMIYSMYSKGTRKSTLCSTVSITMLALELIRPLAVMVIDAVSNGIGFGTLLFERLGVVIDESLSLVAAAFDAASKMYPGLESALTYDELTLLKSSLSLSLSLTPAILATVFFGIVFVITTLADIHNKRHECLEGVGYGLYTVPNSVYFIFNTVTVIYILSLFFSSGLSGFFAGITSALLFLMPHFIILAYARLFALLSRVCGDVFAVILLAIITAAGLFLSAQILFWVLVFFGTSEHRAREYAQRGPTE